MAASHLHNRNVHFLNGNHFLINYRVQLSAIKLWKLKSPLPNSIVLMWLQSLNLLILHSNSVIADVRQVGRASNHKLFNSWSLYLLSTQVYAVGWTFIFPSFSLIFVFTKPWFREQQTLTLFLQFCGIFCGMAVLESQCCICRKRAPCIYRPSSPVCPWSKFIWAPGDIGHQPR